MKTLKYITFAFAALSLTACSNDNAPVGEGVAAKITAGLTTSSRAIDANWNADVIGVMVADAPTSNMEDLYKNVRYSTTSTGAVAAFTCPAADAIFFQDATETVTFTAYAPYQTSAANALPGANADGIIAVDTENNNTAQLQESIDFIWATGALASRSNPEVSFTGLSSGLDCSFRHKMSQLVLSFTTSTDDGFDADDVFDVQAYSLDGIAHTGTFNVVTGVAAATGAPKVVSFNGWNSSTVGSAVSFKGIIIPQSANFSVDITINGQHYLTKPYAVTFEPGKTYQYSFKIKKTGIEVIGSKIIDWEQGVVNSGDAEMPSDN